MLQEYEKNQLDRKEQLQVCCDENTPCVPANINENEDGNSNNKKIISITKTTTAITQEPLVAAGEIQQQEQKQVDYSHKGENPHSKNIDEQEELKSMRKNNYVC